jgi:three-Cys-motif partner protein
LDEVTWDISPHTAAKHLILKKYVQAWAPILAQGTAHKRLVYIDGFAGPGEYKGGEDGSPVLVLKALKEHQLNKSFGGTEFVNIFIEKDERRTKNLEQVIKERVEPLPNWIKYSIEHTEFNKEMQKILNHLETEGKNLAPCFCFVDPFGWSDIDYEVLASIMKYKKAELLITFMSGYLERFVWDPLHINSIKKLYSEEQIEAIKDSRNDESLVTRYFLENLKNKIVSNGGNEDLFSLAFSAYNANNRLEYYLIYLTKNCKGFEVMKNAMFDAAKDGSYKFSDFDFDPSQKTLMDYGQEYSWIQDAAEETEKLLETSFGRGESIPISVVKSVIICKTKWKYKAAILKHLENNVKIKIVAEKRRAGTYPDRGTVVLL